MPKRKPKLKEEEPFGNRMARLRKEAGFSQRDLAAETGISQRMIAYYEKQTQYPPTHLLPILAKAFGVTADQLLGMKKIKLNGRTKDSRLRRRLSQVEKFEKKEKKQILLLLDTFIEREKLRRRENH